MAEPFAVCLKQIQSADVPLRLDPRGRGVRSDEAPVCTNPADLGALQLALNLARSSAGGLPGEVYAISVGPPSWEGSLREALAAGAAHAVRVWNPSWGDGEWIETADGSADRTAFLARAAAEVIASLEPVLVLTGEKSGDTGHACFGAFLAHALGMDFAHRAAALVARGGQWLARCKLERGYTQELVLPRPAVITVTAQPPPPRAPLPRWLFSRTAQIPCTAPALPAPRVSTTLRAPLPRVKHIGAPPPAASAEERIRAMVELPQGGGGTVIPSEAGVTSQAEAIVQRLREKGYCD